MKVMNLKSLNSPSILSKIISEKAVALGFSACGFAKAEAVNQLHTTAFKKWIDNGFNHNMKYMENYIEKRLNPSLLMPNAKSIICVALNYFPCKQIPENQYSIASYALGKDYHVVLKNMLHQLAKSCGFVPYSNENSDKSTVNYLAFCDTAPILERYWAQKAGLGWIGRNKNLILKHGGNFFFLGELLIDTELVYSQECRSRCGKCSACQDACPTKALQNNFDCKLCLSYQTIENRGAIPQTLHPFLKNTIYGCDICIKVCPYNKFSTPTNIDDFLPSDTLLQMTQSDWHNLTQEKYQQLFKGSAVKRAKFVGLMRNISIAKENINTR